MFARPEFGSLRFIPRACTKKKAEARIPPLSVFPIGQKARVFISTAEELEPIFPRAGCSTAGHGINRSDVGVDHFLVAPCSRLKPEVNSR